MSEAASARVRIEPAGLEIAVAPGETLFDAAFRRGIAWPTVCYGRARCCACRVEVLEGHANLSPVEPAEQSALARVPARLGGGPNLRLACQLRVRGPAVLRQPAVAAR
jgi:ferredoxin